MKGWRAGERPCGLPIDFPDMGKRNVRHHDHVSAARDDGERGDGMGEHGQAGMRLSAVHAADERSEETA